MSGKVARERNDGGEKVGFVGGVQAKSLNDNLHCLHWVLFKKNIAI
jgi:hypothetical protein